jgi:hypothetical protein
MIAFYDRYNSENPAIIHVLSERELKKKERSRYYGSEEEVRLAQGQVHYGQKVRRLSHANLRRYPEILNPNGYKVSVVLAYPVPINWITLSRSQHAGSIRCRRLARVMSAIFKSSPGS